MEQNRKCYIIAEAGQNHNGSLTMAKQLIDMAAMPIFDKAFNRQLRAVDAIKFTKRDMSEELTLESYNAPYDSENSFGKTYGEHREKLELSYEDHVELYEYSKTKNIDFIETFTSPKTLKLLEKIDVKYIKVASRDLTNVPLLDEIGKSQKPVILSTGMGGLKQIDNAVEVLTKYHDKIIILHCISQYPAEYENLNLYSIPYLKERYKFPIGYSDHSIGIIVPVVAFTMGAEFIEKHITLSHSLKGSDHRSALEPDGLWRMTRDIRNMEMSLGKYDKFASESVESFKKKLERSLAFNKNLEKGHLIKEEDLILLSPGGGFSWAERNNVIGKKLKRDVEKNAGITGDLIE